MNMFEWHAGLIERQARMLAHTLETTPADRLTWCPKAENEDSKCRTALDQAGECINVNNRFAAVLSGSQPAAGDEDELTPQNAPQRVRESAAKFAAAVRNMKEEDLGKVHDLGFAKMPAGGVLEIGLTNMAYHVGQINQIQLLFGDTEFRFPQDMFS
jgi:hypothetical protein